MGVKSLVQGLNAAAKAGFEPRTVRCFIATNRWKGIKKNLWQSFLDNFQRKRTKKGSKSVKKKVALTITEAGVVARKLTFSNKVSELLDGAPPAPRWLFHYITVTSLVTGLSRTVIVSTE